jgi:hypothetical protein
MSQPTAQGWGTPPPSPPQPPKARRPFLVTKIAVGVAAGIALFLIGGLILLAALVGDNADSGKRATAAAPATTEAAPTDETAQEAPTPAVELAIGDTASITAEDGDAEIAVTRIQAATAQPGMKVNGLQVLDPEPAKHGFYVIAHVKVTGTRGSLDINPFDFYVKSAGGFHTEDAEYLDAWGSALDAATLHAGEHVAGTIVYDVPSRHGKLAYAPNYGAGAVATWTF